MDIFEDIFEEPPDDIDNLDLPNDSEDNILYTSNSNGHLSATEDADVINGAQPNVPNDVFAVKYKAANIVGSENIDFLSTDYSDIFGDIYGVPEVDSEHWHQQERGDSCAIVSQEFILESFYPDQDFSESELVEKAELEGYYTPGGGTYLQDVGELLEDYGVKVERSYDNSIDDIIEKLEANKKIIVSLDANEIWTNSLDEFLNLNIIDLIAPLDANHAVEIIGFDTDRQEIILNDPGHHDGRGRRIPVDQFQLAWNDSGNFLMSTVDSPPMTAV